MKYFQDVVDFVEDKFRWVILTFLVAVVLEIIFFLIRSLKGKKHYEYDNLYTTIISNIVVIIAIYILACLIVGFVNCCKDQDLHFWTNFWGFVKSSKYRTIAIIVGIILGIVGLVVGIGMGGIIVGILIALAASSLGLIALTAVGFLVYVLIAVIIIIFKLIWFIISGFFVSLVTICATHWLELVVTICTPCAIYGMILAFRSYLSSFKENIIER